jgi:hypothetical protein
MHPDVTWPNGWEGGWANGRDGVQHYWQRQWAALDPHVEPRSFSWDADGRVTVSVHQIVRDLNGNAPEVSTENRPNDSVHSRKNNSGSHVTESCATKRR